MKQKQIKPKDKCEKCGKIIKGYPAYFGCLMLCSSCLNKAKYKVSHPLAIKSFLDKYIR